MMTAVKLLAVVAFVSAQQAIYPDGVVKVRAVEHGDAIIPCGQSKIFLDGPEAFVSWLKDDRRVVYRFPINNSNTDERSFNEICYRSPDIKPCRERTSLFLPRVTKDDAGFYRCRIHYNASPAVDFDYYLTIVESPGKPKVFITNEIPLNEHFVGPVPLDTNITLICEVKDSRESSLVQWERDGQKVVGSKLVRPGLHRAVLELRSMQRDQHGTRYACIVQPADVTPPLTKEVEIKMILPPISIKIDLDEKYVFEAGNPKVIDCIVTGFVPSPTIEWYLDNKLLKMDSHQEFYGHNLTMSTITFVAKRSDDSSVLSCRASNDYFEEEFSSNIRLRVGFKPTCVSKPKHRIEIKGSVAEKVVCVVDSDPPPIAFTWTFSNAKIVATPVQDTVIPTRFNSTLTWIPHSDDIGKLNCRATNYHGEQEEPCQFEIGRPDCTNAKGVKIPCEQVQDDGHDTVNLNDTLAKNLNSRRSVSKEQVKIAVVPSEPVTLMEVADGSQAIETHVTINDNYDLWWVPFLYLLGSTFLLGIVCYTIGHWIMNGCRGCEDMSVSTDTSDAAERARSASLTSQAQGSYHREPDIVQRFNHQTNVNITPITTLAMNPRNAATYGDGYLQAYCDTLSTNYDIHTYCV